jgi:hypothetical protein
MPKPVPYTPEQVRAKVLNHMRGLAKYWSSKDFGKTEKERMEGLCFSILNIFDGTTMELPAMDIVLRPHPSDKAYAAMSGETHYYKNGQVINAGVEMHAEFF